MGQSTTHRNTEEGCSSPKQLSHSMSHYCWASYTEKGTTVYTRWETKCAKPLTIENILYYLWYTTSSAWYTTAALKRQPARRSTATRPLAISTSNPLIYAQATRSSSRQAKLSPPPPVQPLLRQSKRLTLVQIPRLSAGDHLVPQPQSQSQALRKRIRFVGVRACSGSINIPTTLGNATVYRSRVRGDGFRTGCGVVVVGALWCMVGRFG